MKIKFTRTGGFVPMGTVCELETAELAPSEARNLEALVYASGIVQMSDTSANGARDVALFTFEIHEEAISPGNVRSIVGTRRRQAVTSFLAAAGHKRALIIVLRNAART